MFVKLSAVFFKTLSEPYRCLESVEMTLFCISDDFAKGFDAIELSTSLFVLLPWKCGRRGKRHE